MKIIKTYLFRAKTVLELYWKDKSMCNEIKISVHTCHA